MKNTPVDYQTARRIIDGFGLPDFGKATIREVVAISTQLEQETGTEFIHMEMGVPGLKAAQVGVDAEIEALRNGIASIYPNINGTPEVKKQASRFIKAFINIDIDPECCVPVTGSMQGTYASFLTAGQCTPGKDTILFIDPGFPVQKQQIAVMGYKYESFFMYGEDIDLSYRIVLGGYKNLYVPERILHYKGESTKHGDLRYIRAFYGAMLIFYKKYYPGSGWLMRILIRLAVLLKACWAMISAPLRKKAKAVKHRRLLILCREDHFEEVKAVCLKAMPDLEFVNLWDLDVERVMDAICRKNQMKGFTDYAFCFPDARYEQMLLFMDKLVNKKAVFHIYTKKSGRLV